jgi:hypothetical protein
VEARLSRGRGWSRWCAALGVALLPVVARADVVWPALVLEDRILTWWSIAAGLLAEWPVVRYLTRTTWTKSFLLNALTNLASTLVGIFLIPAGGFLTDFIPELLFNTGTFNPATWTLAVLFAAAANAVIEGFVLRFALKLKFERRVFWWLLGANLISVGAAMASVLISPPRF